MATIPGVTLINGGSYTLPQKATLSRAYGIVDIATSAGGAVLRLDGSKGAKIVNVATTGTTGAVFINVELNIQLDAGKIVYNDGDQLFLIFS